MTTYEQLKALSAEAFKRYSRVRRETFATMLQALRHTEQAKKKPGRRPILGSRISSCSRSRIGANTVRSST